MDCSQVPGPQPDPWGTFGVLQVVDPDCGGVWRPDASDDCPNQVFQEQVVTSSGYSTRRSRRGAIRAELNASSLSVHYPKFASIPAELNASAWRPARQQIVFAEGKQAAIMLLQEDNPPTLEDANTIDHGTQPINVNHGTQTVQPTHRDAATQWEDPQAWLHLKKQSKFGGFNMDPTYKIYPRAPPADDQPQPAAADISSADDQQQPVAAAMQQLHTCRMICDRLLSTAPLRQPLSGTSPAATPRHLSGCHAAAPLRPSP